MGSSTELMLAVTFAEDTPLEIIGAFGEWRTAGDERSSGNASPRLPTLETSFGGDVFDPGDLLGNLGDLEADPMVGLSDLQHAAMWRYLMGWGNNAYFPGSQFTALHWDPYKGRWSLTARTIPKEPPTWVRSIIAQLGRWSSDGTPERPWFAGYLLDEYSPRPVLIWNVGQEPFRFEGDFEAD